MPYAQHISRHPPSLLPLPLTHVTPHLPPPSPPRRPQIESKAQVAKRRREAQQEFLYTIPVTPQVAVTLGGGQEQVQAHVGGCS